jgi:RNA polymerase sigma-32 factor
LINTAVYATIRSKSCHGEVMRAPLPSNLSRALKKIPRLSSSEERSLIRRSRSGDGRARERLVLSQLRFVIKIAARYRRPGCPLPDLVQEGVLGLMEAIKRFNPDRGVRLSTFAMWWIRSAIQDYVLRSGSIVRSVTTPQQRTMFFSPALSSAEDRNDSRVRALADRLNTRIEDVRAFAHRLRTPDQPLDDAVQVSQSAFTLPDNPETRLFARRDRLALVKKIRTVLPAMTRRERHIIRRRFLGEKRESRNKIGKDLGLSKERVRQLEIRALQKLRMAGPAAQAAD